MLVKNFLDANSKNIIQKMPNEFDSHDFIKQLIRDHERDYVELVYTFKDCNGIFKAFHSEIGKYLGKHAEILSICKLDKTDSENIKGNETSNQKWKKL
jgi:hypothetical protein